MNLEETGYQNEPINKTLLTDIDEWILSRLNDVIASSDDCYDKFEFGEAARFIYNFVWDDFASWYVELTKVVFSDDNQGLKTNVCAILKHILNAVLKLLHPFMPFITEEIWQMFNEGSITVASWPVAFDFTAKTGSENMKVLLDVITAVRNIRAEKNVAMSRKIAIMIEAKEEAVASFLKAHDKYLARFTNYSNLSISRDVDKTDAITSVIDRAVVVIPLKNLIDVAKETERLQAERQRLEKEVDRSTKMLSNPSFCAKAPADKIAAEKEKLAKYQDQLKEVMNLLANISKEGN
jgi:valyl-tRNA synthetase